LYVGGKLKLGEIGPRTFPMGKNTKERKKKKEFESLRKKPELHV